MCTVTRWKGRRFFLTSIKKANVDGVLIESLMTFKCVHTVVHAYVNATEARACATKSVVLKIQQSSKRYGHYFEKKRGGIER